jgi:hypothetical protein
LPWGPPRELDSVRKDLLRSDPSWRSVIVRVSGTHAGWLLGLEAGLHRLWPPDKASADHLWVRILGADAQIGESELLSERFAPPPREATDQLHKMVAVREVHDDGTINMPKQDISTAPGVDLEAPGVLERLWFAELVRRAHEGVDLASGLAE